MGYKKVQNGAKKCNCNHITSKVMHSTLGSELQSRAQIKSCKAVWCLGCLLVHHNKLPSTSLVDMSMFVLWEVQTMLILGVHVTCETASAVVLLHGCFLTVPELTFFPHDGIFQWVCAPGLCSIDSWHAEHRTNHHIHQGYTVMPTMQQLLLSHNANLLSCLGVKACGVAR